MLVWNEEEREREGGSGDRRMLVCKYEHNFQNDASSCQLARRCVNVCEVECGRCVKTLLTT